MRRPRATRATRAATATTALLAAALLLPTGSVAAAPGPQETRAGARPQVLASATDPAGDARFTSARGLTPRERRSIDVRGLTVTDRGDVVRFRLDVRRVTRGKRFRQVYFIDLRAPGYFATQLGVISRSESRPPSERGAEARIVTEGAGTRQGFVECDDLALRFRGGADRWWVDVPRRCLPQGRARVSVYAQTARGPHQFSDDRVRLARRVDVGGTIPPES